MTTLIRMEKCLSGRKCWWLDCRRKPAVRVKVEDGVSIVLCQYCADRLRQHPDPKRYLKLVAPWLFDREATAT